MEQRLFLHGIDVQCTKMAVRFRDEPAATIDAAFAKSTLSFAEIAFVRTDPALNAFVALCAVQ